MKKQEIEQAAQEHLKETMYRSTALMKTKSFIAGATYVNERQPYSKDDLKIFAEWLIKRYKYDDEMCMYFDLLEEDFDPDYFGFDELLKLWEESRNG